MRFFIYSVLVISSLISGCSSNPSGFGDKSQDKVDPIKAARTRVSLALTYLENANYEQAKINLDKALEHAPFLADVHHSFAYYYQQVDEVKLAQKAYHEALKRSPKNPNIINSYGAFLCEQGDFKGAEEYLLAAVSLPNYAKVAETYENLAICAQTEIRLLDAIKYLNKALTYEPSRVKSLRLMTELLLATNQWQEAKQYLRQLERTSSVSAESLWMWVQIEHFLSNDGAAKSYGETLQALYPDSQQSEAFDTLMNSSSLPDLASLPSKSELKSELVKSQNTTQIHIVKAGENLYRISLLYSVKLQQLINWNNLSDPAAIKAGRQLIINKFE